MRQITDNFFVSPQIAPEDAAALKAAGIKRVVCNRPDPEVPPDYQAAAIGDAMRAAGIAFEVLPLTHDTMTPENTAHQCALAEGEDGPVLAYCASGTRSTVAWALGQAGRMDTDAILARASAGGYDLSGLRPTLEAMARRG